MSRWKAAVFLAALGLVPLACQQPVDGEKAKEAHEGHAARKLVLSAEVLADAKVRVGTARRQPLVPTLSLPGEIIGDPDRTAQISSPVPGRLTAVKFTEGARVQKGDVLAEVHVLEVSRLRGAQGALAARAHAARANAKRLVSLVRERLAPEQELVEAESLAQALESEARALREQLAGLDASGGALTVRLRAPMTGIVVLRRAVSGQPITAEQSLGTLVDLTQVWFAARVFEKDLTRVAVGARAEVELAGRPGERHAGTVGFLSHVIDPAARTLTARVRLDNPEGALRIGLFGVARVDAASVAPPGAKLGDAAAKAPLEGVVVPRDAVTEIEGRAVVFVRDASGAFERRNVLLGASGVGVVQLLAGVADGETVVVEGAFTLKSLVLKASLADED